MIVEVLIDKTWCKICILCNPCKDIQESEFTYYFDNLKINSIIAGDFNGHHQTWSTVTVNNFTGRSLASSYSQNNFLTY